MNWATNPHSHGWSSFVGVILLLGLVLVGCGDDEGATTTAAQETTPPTVTSGAPSTPPETEATPPPTETETTSVEEPIGEPIGELEPMAGEVLGVIGVSPDRPLEVTESPGEVEPVVMELGLEDEVALTGEGWWLTQTASVGVTGDDGAGWTNGHYLSWFGDTSDLTAWVVEQLDGEIPTAATMEELGATVAQAFAAEAGSNIIMTVAPTSGDLEEVTYDVMWDVADADSDADPSGWRLHIFATTDDGSSYALKTVEATVLCALMREFLLPILGEGLTEDGGCA